MTLSHLPRAAERRERVLERLGPAALLLPAARLTLRSADSEFPFRQDSDFHYLTGFDEPDAVCVLRQAPEPRYVLFVRPRDRDAEIWNGRRAGVEGACAKYGADAAYPLSELETRLPELLQDCETLCYALGRDSIMDARVLGLVAEHRRTRPRRGRGIVRIEDPGPVVHEMRILKDAYELDRMRVAARVTCTAHARVMRDARPGMHEFEIEAMLEHEFRTSGASGPAYGSIVGTGDNATILHYRENRSQLQEGQAVLVDAGCEVDSYASDVTRTFPAGTRFTSEQAALYDLVLDAQLAAIETVRPGARFSDAHDRAVDVLCAGLVDLGFLTGPAARVRESGDYRTYYMHRTGHWLGLDVHDVGLYDVGGASRVLEPGMVVTVEPGLYVAADAEGAPAAFRGIGIRIEDDVLVTVDGNEVLTAAAPKGRQEIEALRSVAAGVA